MIVIYDCHLWLSFMIVIYDCHLWLSFMIVIYDCHLWLSFMIVIYDCHLWLSFMIVIYECNLWLSYFESTGLRFVYNKTNYVCNEFVLSSIIIWNWWLILQSKILLILYLVKHNSNFFRNSMDCKFVLFCLWLQWLMTY